MQNDKESKTSFKDQALLNQAKNAFQNKHTDQAIECVTQALELNETKVELYLFRSRCYASIARTAEAIHDAEKAIALESEEMKLNSGIQLCGGFYARAEAKFLSGDFEEALVDYNRCASRRHDVLYVQGIDKAQFNIRKAFEFTISQVKIAEQALIKGVLMETETRQMTFVPDATLIRFATFSLPDENSNENDPEISQAQISADKYAETRQYELQELGKREMLLPTAQIHYSLVKQARKNPMYQKLQKLTEDKTFLEFIQKMPNLSGTCQKAIAFINEREKYWKDQNHQNLDINEIKPQPERRTKSVKNMKDFAKYSVLRKQQRLEMMRGTDKNVTFMKMQESRKVFYQKSAQQIQEQNQVVEEQQNEQYFNLVLLNIEECIGNGCDSLAMEFVREFFGKLEARTAHEAAEPPSTSTLGIPSTRPSTMVLGASTTLPTEEYKPYYLQALQIRALLLLHQSAFREAREIVCNVDDHRMPRQFALLFRRLSAIIQWRMGQLEEALLALETLLQEPDLSIQMQIDLKILLAHMYHEEGSYQQALDCCRAVYKPLKTMAEDHGETVIYQLEKEVQLYNKMTVTEVFIKVLGIEADALKELKMELEHTEKVREIKRIQKRLS